MQWYQDCPEERIFGSHRHSRLQAQKGVSSVGLEDLLLTLEHFLLKRCCLGYHKEQFTFYDFSDPTPTWGFRLIKVYSVKSLLLTLEHDILMRCY